MARFAERLLLTLSREPSAVDYPEGSQRGGVRDSLNLLCAVFPDFLARIKGRRVLDFGCGDGFQAVALSKVGARYVLGVDTNPRALAHAQRLAEESAGGLRVEFAAKLDPRLESSFDVVISQNSFEHFPNPVEILGQMKCALTQEGLLHITFGPPWFAPYGSHMHFFTRVPWVNIVFSERTVMNVRKHFRTDGARRYEDVESGLNRMTVRKFEAMVSASGLEMEMKAYNCVKGADYLGGVPLLRELFVNRISCVLRRGRPDSYQT